MRECRKMYLKLKNEIMIIDKKKKKHRKKLLSKQGTEYFICFKFINIIN